MSWTEITKDNVEALYTTSPARIVISNPDWIPYKCYMLRDVHPTLKTMAKHGGYYYIVLPEPKGGDQ